MNETLNQLKRRKSVRVFEDRQIPREQKDAIVEAAFEAPTAGGMMLYTILDITDGDLKDKLAVACDNQPFIAKAPLILIFLADFQRWYDSFQYAGCEPRLPAVGDLLLSYADAVIAAQNTVVAAESMGIGSCYIGDIIENCETVRELLNLPKYAVPAVMLVYGYPTKSQTERRKPDRFAKEYLVFQNRYRRLEPHEHKAMHMKRDSAAGYASTDFSQNLKAFCNRKYMSEFSMEMSRSAAVYLEEFAPKPDRGRE